MAPGSTPVPSAPTATPAALWTAGPWTLLLHQVDFDEATAIRRDVDIELQCVGAAVATTAFESSSCSLLGCGPVVGLRPCAVSWRFAGEGGELGRLL